MNYTIITNNPTVAENYENVSMVNGDFEDVLVTIRNLVQGGMSLVTHPLPASIRLMFAPYRSVILKPGDNGMDRVLQLEIVEDSLKKYREVTSFRKVDYRNGSDYENLDSWLLVNAIHEINI